MRIIYFFVFSILLSVNTYSFSKEINNTEQVINIYLPFGLMIGDTEKEAIDKLCKPEFMKNNDYDSIKFVIRENQCSTEREKIDNVYSGNGFDYDNYKVESSGFIKNIALGKVDINGIDFNIKVRLEIVSKGYSVYLVKNKFDKLIKTEYKDKIEIEPYVVTAVILENIAKKYQ